MTAYKYHDRPAGTRLHSPSLKFECILKHIECELNHLGFLLQPTFAEVYGVFKSIKLGTQLGEEEWVKLIEISMVYLVQHTILHISFDSLDKDWHTANNNT